MHSPQSHLPKSSSEIDFTEGSAVATGRDIGWEIRQDATSLKTRVGTFGNSNRDGKLLGNMYEIYLMARRDGLRAPVGHS